LNEVAIVPLGDIHLGAPTCDINSFLAMVEWIKNTENVYVIGMGDYINLETGRHGVGQVLAEKVGPQEQIELIIKILSNIKDRILAMHGGTHEIMMLRDYGIDPMRWITKELEVPYLKWSAMNKIRVGENNYTLFTTHGSSNARTQSGKMNACRNLAKNFVADIYLMGHTHVCGAERDRVFFADFKKKILASRKRYYVLTGSFLEYSDSYAELRNLSPNNGGIPKIRLWGDKWDIHVSI